MAFAFGADTFMRRAVLEPARRADMHVFGARGLTVHATLRDAVLRTEVLGADRAARRARFAGAVPLPANHQRFRRPTAMRAGDRPGSFTAQRPLRAERGCPPVRRLHAPLSVLHQHAGMDELQRMHHRLHLAAPDLLGAAPLGERRDGSDGVGVRLLLEDRLEIPIQPAQLDDKPLLRRRAPHCDSLGRLLPEMAHQQPDQVARRARRNDELGRWTAQV